MKVFSDIQDLKAVSPLSFFKEIVRKRHLPKQGFKPVVLTWGGFTLGTFVNT